MRIGGWIAATWAVAAWSFLIAAGTPGRVAATCVLVQGVIQFRTVARYASLALATVLFVAATTTIIFFLGSSIADVLDAAARLLAIMFVVPLVSEYAGGFWLCRVLVRLQLPRPVTLAAFSSLSVSPMLLENVTTLRYHHTRLQRRRRLGMNSLAATLVMALDRVRDLEVVDHSFDVVGLMRKSSNTRMRRSELFYLAQLAVMGSWLGLTLR